METEKGFITVKIPEGSSQKEIEKLMTDTQLEHGKYFIPQIEDVRVGYECELLLYNSWEISIIKDYTALKSVKKAIKNNILRVPYLTKEQIEDAGWMHDLEYNNNKNFYKGELSLRLYIGYVENEIINFDISIYNAEGTLYKGECHSINEFRYICKLLKIC